MFTSSRSNKAAYRGLLGECHINLDVIVIDHVVPHNLFKDGLHKIAAHEGIRGLYKGTVMALVGVSNGAIQFMTYEELKKRGKERRIRRGVAENEAMDSVRCSTCAHI